MFPQTRLRRLRSKEGIRGLVRETTLSMKDFIMPLFVCSGEGIKREIPSMPGNYHFSLDRLVEECREIKDLGISGVLLFGLPDVKDEIGSGSWSKEGIIQRALRTLKREVPDLLLISDICFCEYTTHGHCGVLKKGQVDNDATLDLLVKQALSHAEAGADIIAPSDMMDGRVSVIRKALDKQGYKELPIMAYSVKYASSFYGPFRDAAQSAPSLGDRKGYQMDPANSNEALREAEQDSLEGADILMVKPGLSYLDIVYRVKNEINLPLAVYNVSGEYSMVKAADKAGYIDGPKVMMEMLYSMKRAGADIIITYFAQEAARLMKQKEAAP